MPRRLVSPPARALAFLALLLSSLVAVPHAAAVGTPTPQWATFFQQALAGEEGYVYIVAQNGQVVASGASGLARSSHEAQNPGAAWTINTRMNLARVSKTVTAVAVMALVQQGKVSLTAPFLPYIQAKITATVPSGVQTRVTIADLLSMMSGMVVDGTLFTKGDTAGRCHWEMKMADRRYALLRAAERTEVERGWCPEPAHQGDPGVLRHH